MDKIRRGGMLAALLTGFAGASGFMSRKKAEPKKDQPAVVKDLQAKAADKRQRRRERNLRLAGKK